MTATVSTLHTTGYLVGPGHPAPARLRPGWIELMRTFDTGPDADDFDFEFVIAPLHGETETAFVVEVHGETVNYVKDHGWRVSRRG